jgi:hypothetical protein
MVRRRCGSPAATHVGGSALSTCVRSSQRCRSNGQCCSQRCQKKQGKKTDLLANAMTAPTTVLGELPSRRDRSGVGRKSIPSPRGVSRVLGSTPPPSHPSSSNPIAMEAARRAVAFRTKDAHGLYGQLGFLPADETVMRRPGDQAARSRDSDPFEQTPRRRDQIRLLRTASVAAAVRDSTSSLSRMWVTWVITVR